MTPNYTCMSCGHTMFGMAEVYAHKCDPSVIAAKTQVSETPISREMSIGERHARRMGPVSREELVKACLAVRSRFAGNGTELSDAIADAFSALAEELR